MLYERREYICFFHHHILKVAHAWHLGAQLIIFFLLETFHELSIQFLGQVPLLWVHTSLVHKSVYYFIQI